MNLTELLVESKPLNERPVGMLKGIGQSIAAKVLPGSYGAKAAGARDAGKVANQLYKEFFNFIGKTGDKPTNVSLAAFLKSVGVNDTIIGKYTGGSQPAQTAEPETEPSTASQDQGKPKRDYKAEKAKTAANKAAKAQPAAPAPAATTAKKGFNVNVAQTKAQKDTAATAAAGSNAIRYRAPESRMVENVLRKVGTRL